LIADQHRIGFPFQYTCSPPAALMHLPTASFVFGAKNHSIWPLCAEVCPPFCIAQVQETLWVMTAQLGSIPIPAKAGAASVAKNATANPANNREIMLRSPMGESHASHHWLANFACATAFTEQRPAQPTDGTSPRRRYFRRRGAGAVCDTFNVHRYPKCAAVKCEPLKVAGRPMTVRAS
jgi:hypothetical protein